MSPESIPPFKHLRSVELRSRLVDVSRGIGPVLDIDLMLHFTDHSVTHSDRLAVLVDQFIAPVQSREARLSDRELFILYAACYLHDIGMHNERVGDTGTIGQALDEMSRGAQEGEIARRLAWHELEPGTQLDLLRRHHHMISSEMVLASVNAAIPPIGMHLMHEDSPEYIAHICEAHGLDLDTERGAKRYDDLTRDRGSLRVALLAALLRIVDILDESQRRANPRERRMLDLSPEAQVHWFRHHYTEDVTLDPAERAINVWFDFSPQNHAEYSLLIPKLQIPHMEAELSRHMWILHRYDLGWTPVPSAPLR